MKTITISTHEAEDRLIRVISDGNEVADVQFMQGTDKDALDMISDWQPNTELTQWLHTRGIAKQMPLDYDQLNKAIWIWFWLTNEDRKETTIVDGVEWMWHEYDKVWYNCNTLEASKEMPLNGRVFTLPKEQRDLIIKALRFYGECYNRFNEVPTLNEQNEIIALKELIGLMHYHVEVSMDSNDADNFTTNHKVNLPNYNN